MIETFTSIDNLNYPQRGQENAENVEGLDFMFYENIKSQLNTLKKEPSEESLAKILAYSRAK
ncbi:hypothetical protein [Pedobacter nyackensis]|uniref:hypothetical protein n=1 Tax=Pedobacter nyackensis TaxID=475255 RepID=UPI00292CE90A|nr:hypothetical protein [Pedobacter nyackensis]